MKKIIDWLLKLMDIATEPQKDESPEEVAIINGKEV